MGNLTGDFDWGLGTRPEELKFQLCSRLSEKCQKKILRRTVVCGCGLRLRTPLRTRPKEFKFKLWSRLSEKCQQQKRTVVCGCGLRLRTPLMTRPDGLSFNFNFGQD